MIADDDSGSSRGDGMGEDLGMGVAQEDDGLEPGTILLWLGVGIALVGLLFLVYNVMNCPCNGSVGEERVTCVCVYAAESLIMAVGAVIALVGVLTRRRHRRRASERKG